MTEPVYPLPPERQMRLSLALVHAARDDAAWLRQRIPGGGASIEQTCSFAGILEVALGCSSDQRHALPVRLATVQRAASGWLGKEVPATDGFVAASMPTAIALAIGSDGFRDALVEAVNLGGDTFTVAAMVGGMAGAAAGAGAIPLDWRRTGCWQELEAWAWTLAGVRELNQAPDLLEVERRLCAIVRGSGGLAGGGRGSATVVAVAEAGWPPPRPVGRIGA